MRIEVTQADIDAGARRSCYSCPIALAIARAYEKRESMGALLAFVRPSATGGNYWWGGVPALNKRFKLPTVVKKRAGIFDTTGAMTPFEFEIEEEPDV